MSVKYLGVILDSRLTWRENLDVKVRKAQNLLWACGRAYGVAWGLRPRVVHWLYVSIIRPSVTFASRVVTGLHTGHKTLRRHLHLLGLLDSPLCRRCGAEEETSGHILCECEALASLRYAYLDLFFLEP